MQNTFFINIASYRDPELWQTVESIQSKARYPERLKIVICWQYDKDLEPLEVLGYSIQTLAPIAGLEVRQLLGGKSKILLICVPYQQARGVGWARAIAEQLYSNETWYLQLDAHSQASSCWDIRLEHAFDALLDESTKPIISGYPAGYTYQASGQLEYQDKANQVVFNKFTEQGLPTLTAKVLTSLQPIRSSFLAGGFIFTRGEFVTEVGNDKNIFFEGEEICLSLRACSWGYDVFHHPDIFFWHNYHRKDQPRIWKDHHYAAVQRGEVTHTWSAREQRSNRYVLALLGLRATYPEACQPKTLGPYRSLLDFQYQSGLCFQYASCYPQCLPPSFCNYFPPPVDKQTWLCAHQKNHQQSVSLKALLQYNTRCEYPDKLEIHVYDKQQRRLFAGCYFQAEIADVIHHDFYINIAFTSIPLMGPVAIRLAYWRDNLGWEKSIEWPWQEESGLYCVI